MKIAIGSDHGGFRLKEFLKKELSADYEIVDFGTNSEESADYPIHAARVAKAVAKGECDIGIAICTSGIGVSIAANKVRGIRAALVCDIHRAASARKHNNANVLCLGAKHIDPQIALEIAKIFLSTDFDGDKPGEERHRRRVDEMTQLEDNQ
jgi:ribose 5-phosphate isomerase B